jgi:hypothetical protein
MSRSRNGLACKHHMAGHFQVKKTMIFQGEIEKQKENDDY